MVEYEMRFTSALSHFGVYLGHAVDNIDEK